VSVDILEVVAAFVKSREPDEAISEDQHDRLHHVDLAHSTELDLRRELAFTRWANYLVTSEWHQAREEEIGRELQRRYHQRKKPGAA
jgi:hypothetical protein